MKSVWALLVLFAPAAFAAESDAAKDLQPISIAEAKRSETVDFEREILPMLKNNCLAEITTLEDWNAKRGEYRRQLLEMLGLEPLPEKSPLKPVVTGKVEHPEFTVEKLQFQSRPGLYVTGNLYLPKIVDPAKEYYDDYYAVFFLDPDGHKLEGMKYGERRAKAAKKGARRKA